MWFSHLRLVGWDEKINFNVGVYPCSFSLSCQMVSGPFWLKIFPPAVQIPHPLIPTLWALNWISGGLSETFGSWCFYVDVSSGLLSLDGRSLLLIEPDPRLNLNSAGDRYFQLEPDQRLNRIQWCEDDDPLIYPRRLRGKRFCSKRCKGQTSVVQHVVQHVIDVLIINHLCCCFLGSCGLDLIYNAISRTLSCAWKAWTLWLQSTTRRWRWESKTR